MAEACISAGICGFETTVSVEDLGDYQFKLKFITKCPNIPKMAADIETVNVMDELFKKGESKVLNAAVKHLPHVSCPVPSGTLKALEVTAGMALPKDASITIKK
ncbi:DUF6951 family protein [Dehalobacterium formicoaceticum]|uniref:Uncharacterized protein n=1 Tax=Dehalobacterium formicoaceticum TaxID=51515 RepID=A0ABT1Y0S6_9FIRM|nr:hypothetical protein [Dehalobacterium formicoaceticum]MCR6544462.1 hypothetical protein [Dehalobacterium formicoaceticum]